MTGIAKNQKGEKHFMDKQPTCLIGVDQFTVVLLAELGQDEDLDVWPAKVKRIVDEFTQRSEIETFFGHLVPMTTKRPQGSSAALTFDTVPWYFVIAWHVTEPKRGVTVAFSAQAWAEYQAAFEEKYQVHITVVDFLRQIQSKQYATRLSRIDITADYLNYGDDVNVHCIYKALEDQDMVVVDHRDINSKRKFSCITNDWNVQTITIGSKKENTPAKLKIYDKRTEQIVKSGFRLNEAIACDDWTRFEASYRSSYAHQISADLLDIGQRYDTEDDHSASIYVRYLASKILDKYRFKIVDTGEMTSFTQVLQDLAEDGDFQALRSERPENHTLRESTNHLCWQSCLMPLLFKVENIWGEDAIDDYWQHLMAFYRQFYCDKARTNHRLLKWLRENRSSLQKLPLEHCFTDLAVDIRRGYLPKKKPSQK